MKGDDSLYLAAKRTLDIVLSSLGLVGLSPLLIVAAAAVKFDSPGPVLYLGTRVGEGGRPFRMLKFRTMVLNADKIGGTSTAGDDPRLTRSGRWLRRYKLDELPQLVNVLKGDMSLVGPRPQVPSVVDLYTPEERRVLGIRPGITDYASLRFPNEGEILKGSTDPDRDYLEKIHPEKMRLAIKYVDTRSFWSDLKIIFLTLKAILKE